MTSADSAEPWDTPYDVISTDRIADSQPFISIVPYAAFSEFRGVAYDFDNDGRVDTVYQFKRDPPPVSADRFAVAIGQTSAPKPTTESIVLADLDLLAFVLLSEIQDLHQADVPKGWRVYDGSLTPYAPAPARLNPLRIEGDSFLLAYIDQEESSGAMLLKPLSSGELQKFCEFRRVHEYFQPPDPPVRPLSRDRSR